MTTMGGTAFRILFTFLTLLTWDSSLADKRRNLRIEGTTTSPGFEKTLGKCNPHAGITTNPGYAIHVPDLSP